MIISKNSALKTIMLVVGCSINNNTTKELGDMAQKPDHRVYKVVLTGGPCSGKTTGQLRLSSFFENLGWTVYRVPEMATVLLGGGIKFTDLSDAEALAFQENLLHTMMHLENTYFQLAKSQKKSCLIICDRGVMDASAYLPRDEWERMCAKNHWNMVKMFDSRYHQVVHLVTAAIGAEAFYTTEDNAVRTEGLAKARELDEKCSTAWGGHPYLDVIDNSLSFEKKMQRLIECVCQRIGIDTAHQFEFSARRIKFLVDLLDPNELPQTTDVDIVSVYLLPIGLDRNRIQKRTHNHKSIYLLTVLRKWQESLPVVELRNQLSRRVYINMLMSADPKHERIQKKRRCFVHNHHSFKLDIFKPNDASSRCKDVVILQMFTTLSSDQAIELLPACVAVKKDVTNNEKYSMFRMSMKRTSEPPATPQ